MDYSSLTRRVLAILGAVLFFGVTGYLAVQEKNEIALGAMISAGSMIIAYYFGAKTNGSI